MMVSIWWAVSMFFLGACAGTLVFALMRMATREGEKASRRSKRSHVTVSRQGEPATKARKKNRLEVEPA